MKIASDFKRSLVNIYILYYCFATVFKFKIGLWPLIKFHLQAKTRNKNRIIVYLSSFSDCLHNNRQIYVWIFKWTKFSKNTNTFPQCKQHFVSYPSAIFYECYYYLSMRHGIRLKKLVWHLSAISMAKRGKFSSSVERHRIPFSCLMRLTRERRREMKKYTVSGIGNVLLCVTPHYRIKF